jgi:hypothetical protein
MDNLKTILKRLHSIVFYAGMNTNVTTLFAMRIFVTLIEVKNTKLLLLTNKNLVYTKNITYLT